MTDVSLAPAEYWHGVIAQLGVPGCEGGIVLQPPPEGRPVPTATALPLPLYALMPDRPPIGVEPGAPALRVVGDIQAIATAPDRLWARGTFHLHTPDGRAAAAGFAAGRRTHVAVHIRPDQAETLTGPDGRPQVVYQSWVLLAAMLTDTPLYPECAIRTVYVPDVPLCPEAPVPALT